MNKFERVVYDLVKRSTVLKDFLRDSYQLVISVIPQKKIRSENKIIERPGFFFGFHDKIPFSYDNNMLLAHKYDMPNRKITSNDKVEIGYFFGKDYRVFKSLAKTSSWNWQQGAMLQWLNNKNEIIYNDWDGEKNVARIISSNGDLIKTIDIPIGAIDSDGKFALSYSFERLNKGMYGYGYMNENDSYKHELTPKLSGMKIVDLKTGKSNMLFSIYDIFMHHPHESMKNAYHFFSHCLFSPKKDRFLFLHRWYKEGKRLYSRMISCDLNGENMNIFMTSGMVSHITWLSNDQIFAYCSTKENGDGYHIFRDRSNLYRKVGGAHYTSDGHPQYNSVNNLIVTDTYPNRFRIQELSTYDISNNEKKILALLRSPRKFRGIVRCDLHPRWDRLGRIICFDSAHSGERALCTVELRS